MKYLALVLFLYATSVQADFKSDKSECEEWGKAFYIVADWRGSISKSEAYDKIMANAINSEDHATTVNMMRIVYLVFSTEDSSDMWKKAAIANCMKQRGYTGA